MQCQTKRRARAQSVLEVSQKPNDSIDIADSKSEYVTSLGDLLPLKGVPFGNVLNLNCGLVVKACIRVQRCASALYYSNIFFGCCFAGSRVMEDLVVYFSAASTRATLF